MRLLLLTAVLVLSACASTDTRRSTGTVVDDLATVTKIKGVLVRSPATDGLDIEVRVHRGRAQLNGFVQSSGEVEEAGSLATSVRGVASVDNNLQVIPTSRRAGEYIDDKVLITRISAALTKDRTVHTNDIDVEVNRGMVLLGGYVATTQERDAAVEAARRVPGVEQVRSFIELK
jgi:hyperosmotically inducible protein